LGGERELVQGYCDQGCFRRGNICCGNGERRIARDDGVRADLKKGPKRFRFDPFTAFETAPQTRDALASNALPASMLEHRFGLLDCRFVIPRAANGNFAHARGSDLGRRLCLALATCTDARATSCRELVDPCGSLIQIRIHHRLLASMRFNSGCARLVLHWLLKAISSVHSVSAT
jgi:hypothetical protein